MKNNINKSELIKKMKIITSLSIILLCLSLISGCNVKNNIKEEPITNETNLVNEVSIEEGFPEEYIIESKEYLTSKFGKDIVEQSVHLTSAYSMEFEWWGGCTVQISEKRRDEKKWVVEYALDYSDFITFPTLEYVLSQSWGEDYNNTSIARPSLQEPELNEDNMIRVVFNQEGEVECTANIPDCTNHPEYCPPYIINTFEKALESYATYCSGPFNQILFDGDTNNLVGGYLSEEEFRFLWHVRYLKCSERHCDVSTSVYLDPQTGIPISGDLEKAECNS